MITYTTLSLRKLWEKEEEMVFSPEKMIKRHAIKLLIKNLSDPKIEILYGPRQSGKTTIFWFIMDYLNRKRIETKNIWYINLDRITDYSLFENPEKFLFLFEKHHLKNKLFLFIDEMQRIKNPGIFLKSIYDAHKNIKIFVSGSASIEIKAKVKEFLTGRKRLHLIYPLSFQEIIESQNVIAKDIIDKKVNLYTITEWEKYDEVFKDYLTVEIIKRSRHGFYPAVITRKDEESRTEELYEIYNSYLKKDVYEYFRIEKADLFNNLVSIMANQIGNMVNVSEICSLLSGTKMTVNKYLGILRDSFIIYLLKAFSKNKRNEIRYSNKVYFIDVGLRNMVLKTLNLWQERPDIGGINENLIFSELLKKQKLLDEIKYWRTKSKAEVDFIYLRENHIIPVEVKSGSAIIGTFSRSFHSFIQKYKPAKAIFINKDKFGMQKINQTNAYYIPIHWFILYGIELII